jgi:hypothetical protein
LSPPTKDVRQFNFLFTLPGRVVQDKEVKIKEFEKLVRGGTHDGVITCSLANTKFISEMGAAQLFSFFEVRQFFRIIASHAEFSCIVDLIRTAIKMATGGGQKVELPDIDDQQVAHVTTTV